MHEWVGGGLACMHVFRICNRAVLHTKGFQSCIGKQTYCAAEVWRIFFLAMIFLNWRVHAIGIICISCMHVLWAINSCELNDITLTFTQWMFSE